jgi:hypothetical protein
LSKEVLIRLLSENLNEWEMTIAQLEKRNQELKVPSENTSATLHIFNCKLNELYTEAQYHYARARRNKDAIERVVYNVLNDLYYGKNDWERKAAGIQYAQKYPDPTGVSEYVDLFHLEDQFKWHFYALDSLIKSLQAKAEAKITNNSLLKIDDQMLRYTS